MRIVIETYPNLKNGERQSGEDVIQAILTYAHSIGAHAHVKEDKRTGVTHVDVTQSSRIVEEVTGTAAQYLLEAAAAKGISVERLIKEYLSND